MTPTKEQILERARQLWLNDQIRNGCTQLAELNPEVEELREGGYLIAAQQELMRSTDAYAEYLEKEYAEAKGKAKVEFESLKLQPFTVDIAESLRSGIFVSGTSQCGKTTLGFHIAKRLMENGIVVWVIDPSQAWHKFQGFKRIVHVYPLRQKQKVQWGDEATLFDVSRLNPSEQQRFIEAFSANVMYVAINRNLRPNIVVVFEEAHTAFYNGAMRAKRSRETVRLLTQGGNFNIRFIAITQFPAMCDKLLVKLAQQRYLGKTSEPNDLGYLAGIIGKHIKELPHLERGRFVYSYSGKVSMIQVRPYEKKQPKPKNVGFWHTVKSVYEGVKPCR